jgi:membrane fusion protein, multidrug efflux system
LRYREQIAKGSLRFPPDNQFDVTVIQADGSVYPQQGRIDFTNPAFSSETGTFLVRSVFANPKGTLRPGQFVRAKVSGAVRPNAILVPQRAVLQGSKSHFVWVVDGDSKPRQRVVEVGEWHGDDWFITQGLRAGERVVVDGAIRVTSESQLKVVSAAPAEPDAPQAPASAPASASAAAPGSASGAAASVPRGGQLAGQQARAAQPQQAQQAQQMHEPHETHAAPHRVRLAARDSGNGMIR